MSAVLSNYVTILSDHFILTCTNFCCVRYSHEKPKKPIYFLEMAICNSTAPWVFMMHMSVTIDVYCCNTTPENKRRTHCGKYI